MKARALPAAIAAFALVLPAALAVPAVAQEATAPVVNRVVLRVNDRIATLYDYETRRREMEGELLRSELPLAERRQLASILPERVFADIYQEMLLLSRADQLGIVVTDEQVEQQLAQLQERHGFTSHEELEAAVTQSGIAMRDFREQLRKNIRIQDLIAREVRTRIGMDEEIARRYYSDNPDRFTEPTRLQVRELIVLEAEGQTAEDRAALAEAIRRELAAGAALAELVPTYRDRGLTSDVIDHGWVGSGDLSSDLEAAIWELAPGTFSEPVDSRGGLHILEVVDRREAGLRPFAEVADLATQAATQEAFAEQMASYLDELEETAYIQLDPPPGAEGFRQAATGSDLVDELGDGATSGDAAEPEPPPTAPVEPPEEAPGEAGDR